MKEAMAKQWTHVFMTQVKKEYNPYNLIILTSISASPFLLFVLGRIYSLNSLISLTYISASSSLLFVSAAKVLPMLATSRSLSSDLYVQDKDKQYNYVDI